MLSSKKIKHRFKKLNIAMSRRDLKSNFFAGVDWAIVMHHDSKKLLVFTYTLKMYYMGHA